MPIINCEIHETTARYIAHPELVNLYGCRIGEDCMVATFCEIGKGVVIGDRVRIQAFSFLPQGIIIGSDVFIGPGVRFLNDKHPPSKGCWTALKTVVEDGVSVGGGAIILPGVRLGAGCLIGAGAVVTKDVAPGAILVGNPAERLKKTVG